MAAIVRKIGQITAYETQPYVGASQILALINCGEFSVGARLPSERPAK